MKKKITILSTIIFLLFVISYISIGNYFFNYALNSKREKEFIEDNPHLATSSTMNTKAVKKERKTDSEFKKQNPPTVLSVVSKDKLKLNLYADTYYNAKADHKWAIVAHGYTADSAHMTRFIRKFFEKGYSVLAPDLRGHGKSEGEYIGMGWHDRLDMLLWIDQIIEKDPKAKIVLFGISMGGATVMMTAGEELPDNVKAIVEDCGYSSVSDEFIYQLEVLFGLPEFPVINAANTITKLRAGYDLYEASAVKQVANSKTPILFIHGDQDTFVPFTMLDELYEAAKVEKEKLIIPGAGHGEASTVAAKLYWNTVWDFINRFME